MPSYRPTSVLVIAILHFVFGGIGLVLDLCGLAMQSGGQQMMLQALPGPQGAEQREMQAKMEQTVEERLPGNKLINIGEQVIFLAFDAMMLTTGIGLLSMRPWARSLSIAYASLSIVNRVALTLYSVIFVMPVMRALVDDLMQQQGQPNPFAGMMSSIMGMGAAVSIAVMFIYLAYPIAVLIVMFRPHVVAAFRGDYQEPGREEGWGDLPREDHREPFRPSEPDDRYRPDEG